MRPRIAVFAMGLSDHFNGVMVTLEELIRSGAEVRVWTDRQFRQRIEAAGAQFTDLFAAGSVDSFDNTSTPRSVRFVTFAAARGSKLSVEAAAWKPNLVVHDSFALIGRLVAEILRLPRVIITAGHAVNAAEFRKRLPSNPITNIDPRCWAAVERLREDFDIADASPFSYIGDPSPWLNIYKEPAEWVSEAELQFLGPIAFFGALPSDTSIRAANRESAGSKRRPRRLYAAFGTIIWRYWMAEALQALEAIATAAQDLGSHLVIGLGGATISAAAREALQSRGAVVHDVADQWSALRNADVFITHHGLGSTHEAVACEVPMLSLPFFWDQPGLARRALELGVARPLIEGAVPGRRLDPAAVASGINQITRNHHTMRERLAIAKTWELRTIDARPAIARQILSLAAT